MRSPVRDCPRSSLILKHPSAKPFASEHFSPHRGWRALRAERLLNETVYRIDPNEKPCLIDDYCEPRSPERMAWAIGRLESLGFTVTDEGNVRTIVREWEGDLLYADPRYSHTIHFRRYSAGRYCHPGPRGLLDSRVNNLPAQFERLVGKKSPKSSGL
jgi:hypothetical protein